MTRQIVRRASLGSREIVLSPPGGIRRVQADLELSFLGRVAQAIALVPQVALVTQYTDDGQDGVRLTTDQLRDGVRLAPVATDLTGLELFSTAPALGTGRLSGSG
ncbi:MAG: hypothetical protein H6647_06755 [Anaerolineales bacterium]|nr:hypothetical protein [Anaerolineales bacterium]